MNKQFGFTNKKTKVASGIAVGVIAVATAISFLPRGANGDFSLTDLNQQVQDEQSTIANHEARIKNNESDIKSLQDNTNTTPGTHVDVPAAPTGGSGTTSNTTGSGSSTTTSPPPPAISLIKTENQPDTCDNGTGYKHWTDYYSDGTTKQNDVATGSCVVINN